MRVSLAITFTLLAVTMMAFSTYAQEKNAVGAVGPIKFSGLMFGDLFYNADQIRSEKKDINGWQFRRIYFTADYTINSDFSSRFRLEADQKELSSEGKISVFVKDAYLKWKNVFSGSDLVAGISPTPAFDASEKVWGYRSLEKTTMDFFKVVSSRDLGVDLKGKFDENGMASYWVKVGDNTGNKPETDKYKRYYGRLQFKPVSNLLITAYGDYASMPKVLDGFDSTLKDNNAFVAAGFIGYTQDKQFSVGVEGFMKNQQHGYTGADAMLTARSAMGISAFAWVSLIDDLNIVARYDMFDPNTNSDVKNDSETLLIVALDYKVASNVSIMPGVWMHTKEGAENNDLVPRITCYWSF
jgi:hypothetical protein